MPQKHTKHGTPMNTLTHTHTHTYAYTHTTHTHTHTTEALTASQKGAVTKTTAAEIFENQLSIQCTKQKN